MVWAWSWPSQHKVPIRHGWLHVPVKSESGAKEDLRKTSLWGCSPAVQWLRWQQKRVLESSLPSVPSSVRFCSSRQGFSSECQAGDGARKKWSWPHIGWLAMRRSRKLWSQWKVYECTVAKNSCKLKHVINTRCLWHLSHCPALWDIPGALTLDT